MGTVRKLAIHQKSEQRFQCKGFEEGNAGESRLQVFNNRDSGAIEGGRNKKAFKLCMSVKKQWLTGMLHINAMLPAHARDFKGRCSEPIIAGRSGIRSPLAAQGYTMGGEAVICQATVFWMIVWKEADQRTQSRDLCTESGCEM